MTSRQLADRAPLVDTNSLSIEGARITFERPKQSALVAVDDVSVTIGAGSFASIVGPSGCGKTSLLMAAAGLQPLTSGRVLAGADEVTRPGLDRAVVFQSPGLLPWRTVQANIELGLESLKVPKPERRERSAALAAAVGLSSFLNSYPHELSGGMRQRVGIARALAVRPRFLLMDEPFGALDAQTRDRVGAELLRLWEHTRTTVLFITHSIDEAVYLSDEVHVMSFRPGRIIETIPIELDRPRPESIRSSAEFAAYRARITARLEDEVEKAERAEGLDAVAQP